MAAEESSVSLSPEQEQKILEFQEITGNDDFSKAVHILTAYQWQLSAAVQDTLNEADALSQHHHQQQHNPVRRRRRVMQSTSAVLPPVDVVTRVVARPPPMGWYEWTLSMAALPFRLVYSVGAELLRFLVAIVWGAQPPPAAPDAEGDVCRFEEWFRTTFPGPAPSPAPLLCSYSAAVKRAREELRVLLVYLHHRTHPQSHQYCREVMCSEELSRLVERRQLLYWAVDVQSPEGRRVQYVLRGGDFPYLAVLVYRQSRMALIGQFEGMVAKATLLSTLERLLDQHDPELVVARHEKEEREVDQLLRQQQEDAYLQSLRADQEKAERRKQELEEEEKRNTLKQEKAKEWESERDLRVGRLPPEPAAGSEGVVHVVLRTTGGQRMERNFSCKDPLQVLYDFALSSSDTPKSYAIATSYPRKVLELGEDGGPLLEQLNLGRNCVVFVQDLTEDEET